MSSLSRASLRSRLSLPVGICLVALLGTTLHGANRLSAIDADAESTGQQRVPQLQRVADIELKVTQASLNLRHAMLARDAQEQAATLAHIGELKAQLDRLIGDYVAAAPQQDRAAARKVADQAQALWPVFERNLALVKAVRPGQSDAEPVRTAAFTFLVQQTVPARNALLQATHEAVEQEGRALGADLTGIRAQSTQLRWLLSGLTAGFAVALGLTVWGTMRTLRRRVASVHAVAERVRSGDFTQPVCDDGRDEFSPLLASMAAMQDGLADVVRRVRQNAESVATASAQIAQGNQDLSHRTEQQAGALQVTASTMEQLGATVRHNADNAGEADQLARQACAMAEQGGQKVSQVVQTMRRIDESARRIADITSTIDGIAFQTNILALNAAVEAARAGEQGRGFAVVAGEVRTLAQRSAEAAREIKSLIGTSVERVDEGSRLVDAAGESMQTMVEAIRRVAGIVGEIRTASAEQADGVGQVGQAVTEMDTGTQQNAALVEESAAAASSLRRQAEQLVETVGVFRLACDGRG